MADKDRKRYREEINKSLTNIGVQNKIELQNKIVQPEIKPQIKPEISIWETKLQGGKN